MKYNLDLVRRIQVAIQRNDKKQIRNIITSEQEKYSEIKIPLRKSPKK